MNPRTRCYECLASAGGNYRFERSFSEHFLANAHRAFVGTEVSVGVTSASRFAPRFYLELTSGYTLPEALTLTRRHMLLYEYDCSGLAYSYEGDPDLRALHLV